MIVYLQLDCTKQVRSFVLHGSPIHAQFLYLTLNDLPASSARKGVISKVKEKSCISMAMSLVESDSIVIYP